MNERNYEILNTNRDRRPIKAWVRGVPVEDGAVKQLRNIASMPFIHKWVAAMPDVHVGKGATVGADRNPAIAMKRRARRPHTKRVEVTLA